MSLEEFPPNREFLGRNFNNGECIQLVLKSHNGRWLPFRSVQKVFMHELAHCKQMNHSRNFWKVRNQYCEELQELWTRGYLGEGLWGRGRNLYDGQLAESEFATIQGGMVRDVCGGTYRGVGRKRKRGAADKPQLSYAERKERRIKKKFGDGGVALGEDETVKTVLEKGKKVKGKPRVAGSNRGRELRAAAALARFGQTKSEPELEENDGFMGTDDDSDYGEVDDDDGQQARGPDGTRAVDLEGNRLIKVCEGEDSGDDENARREMEELGVMSESPIPSTSEHQSKDLSGVIDLAKPNETTANGADGHPRASSTIELKPEITITASVQGDKRSKVNGATKLISAFPAPDLETKQSCPVCSLTNSLEALTCSACGHVLHTDRLKNNWRCQSDQCKGSLYVNSGDNGVCSLCGTSKV